MAHPLPLAHVDVSFAWQADGALAIDARARTSAQTGVEMEAMVAAAIAALTIYDMAKALDRAIVDRVGAPAQEERRQSVVLGPMSGK